MRRALWGVLVALGLCLVATSTGRAQVGNSGLGVDPFSLYYGWYLPNQAYQAAQPRPEDTINANAQQRQFRAMRDHGDVFEVQSPFGVEGEDPFGAYAPRRSGAGAPRVVGNPHQGNVRGMGPHSTDGMSYFHRTGRYFPQAQRGAAPNGPNKNIYVHRARGGGGMTGMSSMPGFR